MHFTIDQQDLTTIFRLKGSADAPARLDSANVGALKAEFLILAQPDVETLIVDLSEVTYVDSAGLSALLLAERQQSAHGGDVRLVGANQTVQSLLRLTQLDRVFSMYPTLEEAMNAEEHFEPLSTNGTEQPTKSSTMLKTGALAAGGSLGAAALAALMMDQSGDDDLSEFDDDFDDDDDLDDDDDEFDDDDELGDEDLAGAEPGSLDEEEDAADKKASEDIEEDDDLDEEDIDGDLDEDVDPEDFDDLDEDDDDFEDDDLL